MTGELTEGRVLALVVLAWAVLMLLVVIPALYLARRQRSRRDPDATHRRQVARQARRARVRFPGPGQRAANVQIRPVARPAGSSPRPPSVGPGGSDAP